MIYIGDGLTDVPCMRLVKERGGESIAIYHRNEKQVVNKLLKEGRVNYTCPADYTNGSMLDTIVKKIIQKMAISQELINTHESQMKEVTGDSNEE